MKKWMKRHFAFALALLLPVSMAGTALLTEGKEVCAVEDGQKSGFMAKLTGTHIDDGIMHTYVNVSQSVTPVSGATYTIRCRYYDRVSDGNGTLYLSSNTSEQLEEADSYGRLSDRTKAGTEGTLELTYTAGEEDTILTVSLECDPESECYFWDISLTSDQTGETNLLTNADFSEGQGTWIGWTVKGKKITDSAASKTVCETYGHEIVAYDGTLLAEMKSEDALKKDYEDPNVRFSTDDIHTYRKIDVSEEGYMAKLYGTYVDESGKEQTWVWVNQGITPQAGTTYRFQYDYYVETGDATGVIWSDSVDYDKGPMFRMQEQERGTAALTYTAGENDTWVSIRFECSPGSICYIRNVRLTETDSEQNLLRNGDFSEGNGSWIGWSVGGSYISDKQMSDTATVTYGREIMTCDSNLFDREIAVWSIRPEVTETLDFVYRLEIQDSLQENSQPYMDFALYDGASIVRQEQVIGSQSEGVWQFKIKLLPQQMSYRIVSTLHILTTEGEFQQSKTYSMKEYCIGILKDSSTSLALKSLIADMVRYGGNTQNLLQYTNTIDEELSLLTEQYGSSNTLDDIKDAVASIISGEQNQEVVRWKGASLVLDGMVTLRLKFTAEDYENLSVLVAGVSYPIQMSEKNGYGYVDVPVAACNYGIVFTAVFQNGTGRIGQTLTYSVHTYLSRMKNRGAEAALLQTIYRYGQSAVAYQTYLQDHTETTERKQFDTWLYTTEGNTADRLNPQSGGADAIAKEMRLSIMNADNSLNTSGGTVYYISSQNGDDANDGKSSDKAWKSIAGYREHLTQIQAGDTILFERGGVYRGKIAERTVLPLISGVKYGAYGVGAKPAIYGSNQNYTGLGSWKKTDMEHIWVCSTDIESDAGCLVFNHGQAVGVKRLKESENLSDNLAKLKSNFEFYHDLETEKLYLYMDCNPALNFYDIEICENSYMVLGDTNSHDIQIDNLSLKYSGGHAIRFHSGAENITITNCEIGYIGGSLQLPGKDIRYGNAIEFWNGCANLTIHNNWIYQIYDAGFTHQGGADAEGGCYTQEEILFADNLIEYCSFSLEYWAGNPDKDLLKKITYEDNAVRFNGYGWGMVRPSTHGVATINAWGHTDTFHAEDFVIRNNIFDLSTRALIFSHYTEEPNVIFSGNTYYQKEGYVALWEGKTYLTATDQTTMETSVAKIDKEAKEVRLISEERKEKEK